MKKVVESVFAGQPDKVCDQIADALVDEFLRRDPESRTDFNVLGSHGMLMIGGQITSKADFDLAALAKNVYKEIGYSDEIEVFVNVESQSEEMKTTRGASDNVVVRGYATNETRELLPRPLVFAHNIARRIDDIRKTDPAFSWLRPDGKVQLVMEKDCVTAVTLLAAHNNMIQPKEVQTILLDRVIAPITQEHGVQIFINPLGKFTSHGFHADSGANGRKQAVDTYGGLIPQGDAGLSGKDPGKVERAGTYMARYVARYLVEQGLASSALVILAYTMGCQDPILVEAKGVGEKSRGSKMDLTNLVKEKFDFRL
jgi:S-adenosylmethionine synthetase